MSFYTDLAPPGTVDGFPDRVFIGAATGHDGSTSLQSSGTYAFGTGVDYLIDGAQTASFAKYGNVGGVFGTQSGDRYTIRGDAVTVWKAGQPASSGTKYGWCGRVYQCTTAGTFGTSPPTHSSGTTSNGTAQLAFLYVLSANPIGLSFFVNHNIEDGGGAWGLYGEFVRQAGAGTGFLAELVVKNRGSNVQINPYDLTPPGATLGLWMIAGGDPATGVPSNPSSAAIVFKKHGHTWNKPIVFGADSVTTKADGTGEAISFGKGHELAWWASATQRTASIRSDSTAVALEKQIVFGDTSIRVEVPSKPELFSFSFGANPNDGITFGAGAASAVAAGHGKVIVAAAGPSQHIDLALVAKNGGVVWVGPWQASGGGTVDGFIYVKDSAGIVRKLATIT
jgi:hypothetical protein